MYFEFILSLILALLNSVHSDSSLDDQDNENSLNRKWHNYQDACGLLFVPFSILWIKIFWKKYKNMNQLIGTLVVIPKKQNLNQGIIYLNPRAGIQNKSQFLSSKRQVQLQLLQWQSMATANLVMGHGVST